MDDWRLNGQEEYLLGKHLNHTAFFSSETSDHERCEFCFCKLGHGQKSGGVPYCTDDGYYWICEECYNDFKDRFLWVTDDGSVQ